jgi:hypothetical protein
MMGVAEDERLTPVQMLHRQFNVASARADMLKRMITARKAGRSDCTKLRELLQAAEVEKKQAHDELAKAGRVKILSRARSR